MHGWAKAKLKVHFCIKWYSCAGLNGQDDATKLWIHHTHGWAKAGEMKHGWVFRRRKYVIDMPCGRLELLWPGREALRVCCAVR